MKRINELTVDDLTLSPLWEYVQNCEVELGLDETCIQPLTPSTSGNRHSATAPGIIVATSFVTASGARYLGYSIAMHDPRCAYLVQPVIVTQAGHVGFYYGVVRPSSSMIRENYRRLGLSKQALFPVWLGYTNPATGEEWSGVLTGFGFRTMDSQLISELS